jgi:hypothetical protein
MFQVGGKDWQWVGECSGWEWGVDRVADHVAVVPIVVLVHANYHLEGSGGCIQEPGLEFS